MKKFKLGDIVKFNHHAPEEWRGIKATIIEIDGTIHYRENVYYVNPHTYVEDSFWFENSSANIMFIDLYEKKQLHNRNGANEVASLQGANK